MAFRRASSRCVLALLACGLSAGCNSPPPLSNATALSCPRPGELPFHLSSNGFVEAQNGALVADETRSKDEASDTLGVPDGPIASVFIADADAPAPGPVDYHGRKARTGPNQGLFADGLPGENVSLWSYDAGALHWQMVGRAQTDGDGFYDLPSTGFVAPNGQPLYAVLEADGSCAAHYDYRLAAGTKFVVADIDGTLTLSDSELIMQLSDGSYTPVMMTAANTMLQTWAKKGYVVVYLTARNHMFRAETRGWLDQLGFPNGPVITTGTDSSTPQPYKALWLKRMIQSFGWQAVAAYGNATTDIGAYAEAGIPTDVTFIIGPVGGQSGTVAIANDDYTSHIASFVDAQPDAN
jgi:hypothetical protein